LLAALALACALPGCNMTLGELGVVSARKVHERRPHEIFYPRVTVETCPHWASRWLLRRDAILERALSEALAGHPEANALVLVEIHEKNECLTVSGFAAVVH
jgi:hypothetical protein